MECKVTLKQTMEGFYLYAATQRQTDKKDQQEQPLTNFVFACTVTILRFCLLKPLDIAAQMPILSSNNTPPASHLTVRLDCSAPRGVTRFWRGEK